MRPQGTVKWLWSPTLKRECWRARWTRGDGTRTPWHDLDTSLLQSDEAGARRCAASFAGVAKATTKDGTGESLTSFSSRWLASREVRRAKDNRSHLTHHILPLLGRIAIQRIEHAHGDELVAYLDGKIADGTMSDKSARNVWATARKMLKDATHAKPSKGLKCLDVDPFEHVQLPERTGTEAALQMLRPDEFLKVMAHPRVPTNWKRNIAIAVFLGLRDGEQRVLLWKHCDLESGLVYVCETFDRFDGKVREGTKTGASRHVPIPAPLLPLLQQMHETSGGVGLVCTGMKSQRTMARSLRAWLRVAGVTRPELFEKTSVNRPIRWHDLRASTASWMCAQGRTMTEVRDVLGHTETQMTDRYTRNGTLLRTGRFGEMFPELPAFRQRSDIPETVAATVAISQANLRGGRDSNPRPPA